MVLATAFTVEMTVHCEMGMARLYLFFSYDIRLRLWSLLLRGGECISMVYGVALLCGVTVFTWLMWKGSVWV